MSKVFRRQKIVMPSLAEDRAITAAARNDPDAKPLTPRQLKAMVPMPALRGRPKSEHKKLFISVCYGQEVIEYFRSTDECWQSRMGTVLLKYVERQIHQAS